jgi:hypothetical protein
VRDAIEQAGGYVFKAVGDAFCAAFSSARAGLNAALAAQSWPTSRPILVRMGLHAGVCEERDGDYFGPAVNRVARLLAVAGGGQVLVSAVAAELLSDELPDGVGLRELGTRQLKDLSRPERIYQVEAAFLAVREAVRVAEPPGRPAGPLASDADRDRVVEVLKIAAADGGSPLMISTSGLGTALERDPTMPHKYSPPHGRPTSCSAAGRAQARPGRLSLKRARAVVCGPLGSGLVCLPILI